MIPPRQKDIAFRLKHARHKFDNTILHHNLVPNFEFSNPLHVIMFFLLTSRIPKNLSAPVINNAQEKFFFNKDNKIHTDSSTKCLDESGVVEKRNYRLK